MTAPSRLIRPEDERTRILDPNSAARHYRPKHARPDTVLVPVERPAPTPSEPPIGEGPTAVLTLPEPEPQPVLPWRKPRAAWITDLRNSVLAVGLRSLRRGGVR